MATRIGITGFGEVGTVFSTALAERGAEIYAYDLLLTQTDGLAKLQDRKRIEGIQICSLEEMIGSCDLILSTVTTQAAREVARECAKRLSGEKTFVDLNSTSPSVKVEIHGIIQTSGANFVEGAILGAVGATGAQTKILTAGRRGQKVADILNDHGLNVVHYSEEIGKASMFKMLRSIFSKGIENVIIELLIAGKRAGIEKDLWEDITDFMSRKSFDHIASNWVQTHALAYERRYHEMVQVLETMREIGVDPVMTSATEAFFKRSLTLGFEEKFPEKPASFEQVIEFMENRLHKNKT